VLDTLLTAPLLADKLGSMTGSFNLQEALMGICEAMLAMDDNSNVISGWKRQSNSFFLLQAHSGCSRVTLRPPSWRRV